MKFYLFPKRRWNDLRLYAEMLTESISYLGWAYFILLTLAAVVWLGVINLCVLLDSRADGPFWGWEAIVCLLFAHMTIAAILYEAARQERGVL